MEELKKFLNSKRITTVAVFDEETNRKIEVYTKPTFCKVPILIKNRTAVDTLPYHFTLRKTPKYPLPNNFFVNSVRLCKSDKGGWNINLRTEINQVQHHISLSNFETEKLAKQEFDEIAKKFQPFTGKIKSVNIYEIYPAKLLDSKSL